MLAKSLDLPYPIGSAAPIDWMIRTSERKKRGEALTPIEESILEMCERVLADVFNRVKSE